MAATAGADGANPSGAQEGGLLQEGTARTMLSATEKGSASASTMAEDAAEQGAKGGAAQATPEADAQAQDFYASLRTTNGAKTGGASSGASDGQDDDWLFDDDEDEFAPRDGVNGGARGATPAAAAASEDWAGHAPGGAAPSGFESQAHTQHRKAALVSSMEGRDTRKVISAFEDAGYREGITAGKLGALQGGFDEAFAQLGAPLGARAGALRGRLDVLLAVCRQLADALGEQPCGAGAGAGAGVNVRQKEGARTESGAPEEIAQAPSPHATPRVELAIEDAAPRGSSDRSTSAARRAAAALGSDSEDASPATARTASTVHVRRRAAGASASSSSGALPFFISSRASVPPAERSGARTSQLLARVASARAALQALAADVRAGALALERLAPPDWEALAHEREHERAARGEAEAEADADGEAGAGAGAQTEHVSAQERARRERDASERARALEQLEARLAAAQDEVLRVVRELRDGGARPAQAGEAGSDGNASSSEDGTPHPAPAVQQKDARGAAPSAAAANKSYAKATVNAHGAHASVAPVGIVPHASGICA